MRGHGPGVAPAARAAGWPAAWRTALEASTDEGRTIDVHGHLWPEELVEVLRRRRSAPRLAGWVLHLDGEAPLRVNPDDHDLGVRGSLETDSRGLCLLSLSAPLGIESLPTEEGAPLLEAWHDGVARLPEPFAPWASVAYAHPDLLQLKHHLQTHFVGLQVPATWLATPSLLETLAPTLAVCEAESRPVFVHPGPAGLQEPGRLPPWWPSVVAYTTQLQAAWWAWQEVGRSFLPDLRICFAAGAGLAPAHHERLVARGGAVGRIDPGVFVETSSYGRQAIDALTRVLGVDGIVLGSDRPYGRPVDAEGLGLGRAAARSIQSTNPRRLLLGGTP